MKNGELSIFFPSVQAKELSAPLTYREGHCRTFYVSTSYLFCNTMLPDDVWQRVSWQPCGTWRLTVCIYVSEWLTDAILKLGRWFYFVPWWWRKILLKTLVQFYVLLTVHPRTISQINPTRCTILLKYVCLFLFSTCFGHPCAHHQESHCFCATLVFVTLYGWRLVSWLDWNPTNRPDATHTEWQIPASHRCSNFLLMTGTWMLETCREDK